MDSLRPSSKRETALLVRRAQQGCRTSFGQLVERYWPAAVAMALARTQDPVLAEDIAQESFVVAYTRLAELREHTRFAGWLASIVFTQTVTQHRRAVVRRTEPLDEQATPARENQEECSGMSEQQRKKVLDVIARLPVKYRQVIAMRFGAGLSASEIAQQLGKRPGTVREWLSRAYKTLRPSLKSLADEVMQS